MVEDGVTGCLVKPGDAAGLGAALARVLGNDTERVLIGQAARAFVRPRFGVDGYVSSITSLYDRLLAAKGLA